MTAPPPNDRAYARVSQLERRVAATVALGLVGAAFIASGVNDTQAHASSLLPALTSAASVAMLVSAALLFNQYRTSRFAPYAYLGTAYGATASLLVAALLASPGLASRDGFGAGLEPSAWLWLAAHAAFLLLAGGYVWSQSFFTRRVIAGSFAARRVRVHLSTAMALTAASIGLVVYRHAELPPLILHDAYSPFFHHLVEAFLLTSCAVVLATLVARTSLRTATDLWLAVVLVGTGIELYLAGDVAVSPLGATWSASAACGCAWQSLFLLIQLRHADEQLAAFAADRRNLVEATLRDPLTTLYNRRGYDDRYADAVAECRLTHAPLALLALDLDHFKAYNDHYGHLAGDEALRAVGCALAGIANRPGDACCRVGGEEFAIVLSFTDKAGACAVAERACAAVQKLRIPHAPGAPLRVMTVSIGVAAAHGASPVPARILQERADGALYEAKRLGRNRVALEGQPSAPLLTATHAEFARHA